MMSSTACLKSWTRTDAQRLPQPLPQWKRSQWKTPCAGCCLPDPWADCPRFTESVRRHSIQVYRLIDRHIPEPDFVPQPCGKIYLVLTAINWSAITPEQAALFSDIALRYLSDVSDRMREMKGLIENKQLPFVDALTSDTA